MKTAIEASNSAEPGRADGDRLLAGLSNACRLREDPRGDHRALPRGMCQHDHHHEEEGCRGSGPPPPPVNAPMAHRGMRVRRLVPGLIAALFAGCALAPYRPPSEEIRAQIGTVGVISPRVSPKVSVEAPTGGKGTGAAKGAGLGAGYTLRGGAYGGVVSGGPFGLALGLALGIGLAPVGALVGGVYGAAVAEPASAVQEAERALTKAVAERNLQEAIRDLVLEVVRRETGDQFVSLAEHDPPASEGPGTILEVSVAALGLAGPVGVNPPLALVVEGCARLIRNEDGAELYALPPSGTHPLVFVSPSRKFVEWAEQDARLFREELGRAYTTLAEKIVEELFLVYRLPGRRWEAKGSPPHRSGRCPSTAQGVAP